jgi:hypothetical protein
MNPFINLKKRSISLPNGCKDLIDVLQRPKRADQSNSFDLENTVMVATACHFIHLILFQAQQDHATVLVIGSAPANGNMPMRYLIEGTWHDMAPFPSHIRPTMMTVFMRMAHLPVGQFPCQGVLDETFNEVRLTWRVELTGMDHDCLLTRL